jgi:hypothetical protein
VIIQPLTKFDRRIVCALVVLAPIQVVYALLPISFVLFGIGGYVNWSDFRNRTSRELNLSVSVLLVLGLGMSLVNPLRWPSAGSDFTGSATGLLGLGAVALFVGALLLVPASFSAGGASIRIQFANRLFRSRWKSPTHSFLLNWSFSLLFLGCSGVLLSGLLLVHDAIRRVLG